MKHPNGRPFWDSPDDIDVAIYADALVMLWRFLPEVESIELFRSCLLSERSDAIKLCAVTAMHTLARDVSQEPFFLRLLTHQWDHRPSKLPTTSLLSYCGTNSRSDYVSSSRYGLFPFVVVQA
jgi:hypothetical protein